MKNGRRFFSLIYFETTFLFLFFLLLLMKSHSFQNTTNTNDEFINVNKTKLEEVASQKIATLQNSPLVITGANYEYVSTGLLPNFLCSIQKTAPAVLEHLLVFPLDSKTKKFISKRFPKIFVDEDFGQINTFSSKKYWDVSQELLRSSTHSTAAYLFFLMKKALFLAETLKQTRLDIIWTDSDLVWLEDVREWFINLPKKGCDIMFADDKRMDSSLNSSSQNAGFYYARNTPSTRKLFELWSGDLWDHWRDGVGTKEQAALKRAMYNLREYYQTSHRSWGNYPLTASPNNFTMCFLPQDKFPHYKSWKHKREKENVAIVHPNIGQKEKKDQALRDGFWFWDSKKGCVKQHSFSSSRKSNN